MLLQYIHIIFIPYDDIYFLKCTSPERYDGCVVPWCLYLRTIVCSDERGTFRHLEIAPEDEPDLWSTIFFPEVFEMSISLSEALKAMTFSGIFQAV